MIKEKTPEHKALGLFLWESDPNQVEQGPEVQRVDQLKQIT